MHVPCSWPTARLWMAKHWSGDCRFGPNGSHCSTAPLSSSGSWFEEVALQRPVGGPIVLREQLQRLLGHARKRNVSIWIMPTASEAHMGLHSPMVLLETGERRQVACVEGQTGSYLLTDQGEVSVLGRRYGTSGR
ncbi:Scr1 family TA system antitoxin-like transcriptional regulator [Saccharothrix sp. ST-888]|uniref:Scr1 family TA system antitoxin-like transcriptional regulator n=1 Tax=Saccharothrix sp. ST-888 TaxID=1427391 RepID=UPI003FA7C006